MDLSSPSIAASETAYVLPHERCHWIAERIENDRVFHFPIRVQHIAVDRDGELRILRDVLGRAEEFPGVPEITHMAGLDPVDKARAWVEALRNLQTPAMPGLFVASDGETFVDAEHPALEVIEDGHSASGSPFTSYPSAN